MSLPLSNTQLRQQRCASKPGVVAVHACIGSRRHGATGRALETAASKASIRSGFVQPEQQKFDIKTQIEAAASIYGIAPSEQAVIKVRFREIAFKRRNRWRYVRARRQCSMATADFGRVSCPSTLVPLRAA